MHSLLFLKINSRMCSAAFLQFDSDDRRKLGLLFLLYLIEQRRCYQEGGGGGA
jgi:hypothetical protein